MAGGTEELFREDAYLRSCAAEGLEVGEGGVVLDRTVFYPRGGGQLADTGVLRLAGGAELAVTGARKGGGDADPPVVLHLVASPEGLVSGAAVEAAIDWERRHRLMRVHSL